MVGGVAVVVVAATEVPDSMMAASVEVKAYLADLPLVDLLAGCFRLCVEPRSQRTTSAL